MQGGLTLFPFFKVLKSMIPLKELLQQKKPAAVKRLNRPYEEAKRIADIVGVSPLVIMRLEKEYGVEKVQNLYSWLKDYPNLDPKRAIGLLRWRLKQQAWHVDRNM